MKFPPGCLVSEVDSPLSPGNIIYKPVDNEKESEEKTPGEEGRIEMTETKGTRFDTEFLLDTVDVVDRRLSPDYDSANLELELGLGLPLTFGGKCIYSFGTFYYRNISFFLKGK